MKPKQQTWKRLLHLVASHCQSAGAGVAPPDGSMCDPQFRARVQNFARKAGRHEAGLHEEDPLGLRALALSRAQSAMLPPEERPAPDGWTEYFWPDDPLAFLECFVAAYFEAFRDEARRQEAERRARWLAELEERRRWVEQMLPTWVHGQD